MRTRAGDSWAIPYPQESNDIPMIMGRKMDARDFADMILDQFEEMRLQAQRQPSVMGIASHPYIVGQPYRSRHSRRASAPSAAARDRGEIWFATPGQICRHVDGSSPAPGSPSR
ncbi:hypothetical protein OY671_011539 [Metschnikowia pulcherrima]|nr:hypothetical protein OY671_011539 [Metschnikowia pulcherrima]